MHSVETLLEVIRQAPLASGLLLLFAAALIEYVFPPFPGDTVVLFGAFLAGIGIYPLVMTFTAITAGSLLGSAAIYAAGYYLGPRYHAMKIRLPRSFPLRSLERAETMFVRWGNWIIIGNRFLPAIRATFLLGAGLMRIPPFRVISLNLLSLLCWNSILMFVGFQIGANWPLMKRILSTYSKTILAILVILLVFVAIKMLFSSRKKPQSAQNDMAGK